MCCTTSPPQAADTRARLVPPSPAPAPPPGDCSWGSPEEHREGELLSKQMAPAPSLPSAALLFPGGTVAFCLPSYGLWGALGTARHWGIQATARVRCVGWREARVRMSPVGCSLQAPQSWTEWGKASGRPSQIAFKPCGAFVLERAECPGSAGGWAASRCQVEGGHWSGPAPAHPR